MEDKADVSTTIKILTKVEKTIESTFEICHFDGIEKELRKFVSLKISPRMLSCYI